MKINFFKMWHRVCVFHFFFAAVWSASIPGNNKPDEAPAVSFKDKLCHKTAPALNISEVCSTSSEPLIDSPGSTLRFDSKSSCDHAVFLVQKLCKTTQSNSNLIKSLEANVTSLFSTKEKLEGGLQYCEQMLKERKELGYANSSDTNDNKDVVACIFECVNNDNGEAETLCTFIRWSWTYIKNHSKGFEVLETSPAPNTISVDKVKLGTNPAAVRPINSNNTTPQQLVELPELEMPKPEILEGVGIAQAVENSGPIGKANGQIEDTIGNDMDANLEPEGPNSEKDPKIASQPSQLVNEPPALAGEKKGNDAATKHQEDISNKSPASAKPEEEENLAREGEVNEESHDETEDQGGNNLEEPLHGKLPFDDKKDLQGIAKNSKNDNNLDPGDNVDGEDLYEESEPQVKRKKKPYVESHERMSTMDEDIKKEDLSHFFFLFFVAMCVCIVLYLIYQNKRKIIAMALEGKKGRHSGRRRPTSASYQKLDNKLDEVMASSPPPSKTHVIY